MVYKWYILPIGGLYATYHLLGEPVSQPLNRLEVHPMTDAFVVIVITSPIPGGLWDPGPKMAELNGLYMGVTKYLLSGVILQVGWRGLPHDIQPSFWFFPAILLMPSLQVP